MADEPRAEFVPSGFFALRTPLLSFDTLLEWADGVAAPAAVVAAENPELLDQAIAGDRSLLRERLAVFLDRADVREALFVASPSLEREIGLAAGSADDAARAENALVRYLMRMAGRATPFGLFAGCSVGILGTNSALTLPDRSTYARNTRLDADYLDALARQLGSDAPIREALEYRPNSSLFRSGNRFHYAESSFRDGTRTYHLVALDMAEYLHRTLSRAAGGARLDTLAAALQADDLEVSAEEAFEFLHELVDSAVLVSRLAPPVTGRAAIDTLLEDLPRVGVGESVAHELERTREALAELDRHGLGNSPDRYREIAGRLESLPAKVELSRLYQVDLYKPCDTLEIDPGIVDEVARGVKLLHLLSGPKQKDAMGQFADAFTRRYEEREVSLTDALDEELGIGFAKKAGPAAEASPLLKGIDLPRVTEQAASGSWSRRDAVLLEKLLQRRADAGIEMVLEEAEIASMAMHPIAPLPDAFGVTCSVEAESAEDARRGEFRVAFQGGFGPSGVRMLGRFCHADARLREWVERHVEAEEALHPQALFAEVVHLPQGRLGNVLFRPVLRKYEIPFLGRPAVEPEFQLPVTDLRVSVREGRVLLRSERLDREIIPRLTSAHNFVTNSLGIYHFLCALQGQGVVPYLSWSWGPLQGSRFLPRVRCGRVVLAPALWQLSRAEIQRLEKVTGGDRFRVAHQLREERQLPRWVHLADGDNRLPVDLDNALSVDAFTSTIRRRGSALLTEIIPDPQRLCVRGPEGRFTHEMVIPFVRTSAAIPDVATPRATRRRVSAVTERFAPGSEWLYVKVYAGASTADQVMRDVVAPVTRNALTTGAAEGWFFVRYYDEDVHLRVRWRGRPDRLLTEVLPAFKAGAAPLLDDGRIWKMQLDTYERETDRYGGPEGIELAEQLFQADSDAALAILESFPGDEGIEARWKLALVGIDRWLVDLGLDLEAKYALMQRLREGFGREFSAGKRTKIQLGDRFRAERRELQSLFESEAVDEDAPLAPGFAALRRRSAEMAPLVAELQSRWAAERLSVSPNDLAISYVHMFTNRLVRSAARAHELVLYDFLERLYDSTMARRRAATRSRP